ncbi:hypothetical protein ACX80N_15770 [Arthrobacter sp. MDT2-16]
MAHDDAGSSPAGEGRRSAFPELPDGAPAVPADAPPARGTRPAVPAGIDASATPTGAAAEAPAPPAAGGTVPHRVTAVLGSTMAGGIAAVFGTVLHGQLVHLGPTALPVGALAALVLAGSLFLLCGLWARNVILTAVAGAVAYGIVALLSTSSKTLILTGSSEAAPGTALAGNLWLFGVLAVTLAAVVTGSVLLRPVRRR